MHRVVMLLISAIISLLVLLCSISNVHGLNFGDPIFASDGLGTYYRSGPSADYVVAIYDDIPETLYLVVNVHTDSEDCCRFRQMRPTPSAATGFTIISPGTSRVYGGAWPGYTSQLQFNKWYTTCDLGDSSMVITLYTSSPNVYTVSGTTGCVDEVILYTKLIDDSYAFTDSNTSTDKYKFDIFQDVEYRITFDGAYYDFTCIGDEVFDYDACLYVYGYTCGIEHIKLWKDDGGWVLEDTYYHATIGVNSYEMVIESGNDYKLNFSDGHEYLFSCTGDHVLYDWDRCPWAYPPNGDPVPIIIYVGYDNRIVLLQDAHGNFIEHSQIAVYDQTDDIYLQKWTDNPEGYLVLTARFDTDHDVQIAVRTFDSVHTTTTIYPMNGTAENLTWTNWTIPIMYNIQMEPVDTYNVPLFDVFCGLAEYTPINPLSFWGMDFNRGYVSVTNCSGFSRCDIIAEKGGYASYEVTGLNWTSRSAMVKDYRHTVVLEAE